MADVPGNSTTDRTLTVGGTTITDALEVTGDHDWYRIDLTAGQKVTIAVNLLTLEDSYLSLRNSNGTILAENDDGGGGRGSRLVFTAPTTGTYYIDVAAWTPTEPVAGYTGTGSYALSASNYVAPSVGTLDEIAYQMTHGFFGGDAHHFDVTQGGAITVDLSGLTAAGRTVALQALQQWTDIIGVNFVQQSGGAQITFDDLQQGTGAFADATYADGITTSAIVNVAVSRLNLHTYMHEIGHALGIGHTSNSNAGTAAAVYPDDAIWSNDGAAISIMSYFDNGENAFYADQGFSNVPILTPQVADIIAMGNLYGLSTTTRVGNTTYGFHNNSGRSAFDATANPNVSYTIFDSGGIDTLDYSGFASNQRINLNAEAFSNIGALTGNVVIARGTVIENAIGGTGADTIIGNSAANVLDGGAGSDAIDGGGGDDEMRGGAGDDSFVVDSAGDRIVEQGGGGSDTVFSYVSSTLGSNVENLTLLSGDLTGIGNELANVITGNSGNDILSGLAGDDQLLGMNGGDVLIGGEGSDSMDGGILGDLYVFGPSGDHSAAEIHDTGVSGTDEVRFTATGTPQTLRLYAGDTGIERVVIGTGTAASAVTTGLTANSIDARAVTNALEMIGNSGANTLQATAFADSLSGGNGIDRLFGFGGNDLLDGGREADVMYGGLGDDSYVVDNASDAPIELAGEGTDVVLASVAHTLKANVEDLTLTGAYSITGRGNDLANVITGNSGSNRLWGEAGNDTLIGNGGNDQLDGGAGGDSMSGGTGNDIYFLDSAGDTVTELLGEGIDRVETMIDYTLGNDVENLRLSGTGDIDGIGNELGNTLWGNGGANSLSALGGNDKIYAGAGADIVDGGSGNDWLEGGAGRDELTGGTGSDRFVFRSGDFGGNTTATADVIHDFTRSDGDKIRLDLVDANTNLGGTQDFAFIGSGAFTGVAGQLRYEQISGNTYVSGDTNGDGIADFMIKLDGLHTIVSGDFII